VTSYDGGLIQNREPREPWISVTHHKIHRGDALTLIIYELGECTVVDDEQLIEPDHKEDTVGQGEK